MMSGYSMGHGSARRLTSRVLGALGLFGGTQAMGIVCSVVRMKLVALWIGAAGVGLFGLFNTTIELISTLSRLGVRESAVRDIASRHNHDSRSAVIAVVRRWTSFLGLAGAFLTLTMAPLLSRITFGDSDHTWSYMWLSVVVFVNSLTGGELAVMQGCGQLRKLARASLWGAIGGLALSVPMFYWLGIDSVVPSICVYSACTLIAAFYFRDRPVKVKMPVREVVSGGAGFVRLGAWMTVSAFVTLLSQYIFLTWLNMKWGTEDVGAYQAGFTLVDRYVGVVLTAVVMEYYPRLSSGIHSRLITATYVNHEVSLIVRILLPCMVVFILVKEIVIRMLFTDEFLVIGPYVSWAVSAMPLKCASWCLAFVLVARGDGKTYVMCEAASAVLFLLTGVTMFSGYGLTGLGYAYLLWYAAYFTIVSIAVYNRSKVTLKRPVLALVILSSCLSAAIAYLQ